MYSRGDWLVRVDLVAVGNDTQGTIFIGAVVGLLVVGFVVWRWQRQGALKEAAGSKQCPDCRSRIPVDAKVCRYCQYRFDEGKENA